MLSKIDQKHLIHDNSSEKSTCLLMYANENYFIT